MKQLAHKFAKLGVGTLFSVSTFNRKRVPMCDSVPLNQQSAVNTANWEKFSVKIQLTTKIKLAKVFQQHSDLLKK